MAGLFDKQAKEYADARPTYPKSWFSQLASLTSNHSLAWDVGAGNGQASVAIAEHYDRVIATDISEKQLNQAQEHPRVSYITTPPVLTDDFLRTIIGPEGSVDLVTVATAVHWFDLETFYSQVQRFLRKPGGVIAVWCYHYPTVTPALDTITEEFVSASNEYRDPRIKYLINRYTTLPFPFQPVLPGGAGGEGNPVVKEMQRDLSLKDYLGMFRSSSAAVTAREKGTELLNENVIKGIKEAWGDEGHIYPCKYEVYMLIGTILE